jgi:uncharacterized protein (DUF885 family)
MRTRLRRIAAAASVVAGMLVPALVTSSCGGSATPPAEGPSPPRAALPSSIEGLGRVYVALQPSTGRVAGLHEHDGKVADVTKAGIEARIATLREMKAELATLGPAANDDETLDRKILAQMIEQDLFELVDVQTWRTRPAFYSELFSVDDYIVRDYAPLPVRAQAMLDHLRAARAKVSSIRANLASPLSQPVVKTAIDIYRGFSEYLRGDVQTFLDKVADEAVKKEAKALALAQADEADAIAKHLESVELPKADQSHVLGRERYEALLRAQEALTTPIEELEKMAEEDLQRNKAAYEALQKSGVQKTRPPAADLLEAARKVTSSSKAFIVERAIVTLPTQPNVEVAETPPFQRWNSAFLNGAGAFDRPDLTAYYYITLPDPKWPAKEQEEYVMSRGEIVSTTVHEVFPGHYLQGLWQQKAPTFMQKVAWSYSFGEGWAHYVEQMMVEEGFEKDSPETKLGQLSDALLRNCRFVASIGIHVRGWSVDDAKKRFMDDCKQDEAGSRQQAVRGTFDPGYFAYTLGKLQILALREEAKKKLGDKFQLRAFHDALLAHGAPPVPLIRDRVLAEIGAQ